MALAGALLSPAIYAPSIVMLRAQTVSESVTVIVAVKAALVVPMPTPVIVVLLAPRDGLIVFAAEPRSSARVG